MNRSEIYSGEQGRTFDQLWQWKDNLASLGGLEISLSGSTATVLAGLAASASAPASLVINLAQGWIYQQAAMDSTAYGSLPSDNTVVQQQGFAGAQTVTLTTAGLSAGQSQWALIQAQFSQQDVIRAGDPTGGLLYYFNSANPTVPFQGPNGNGQTQATERQATIAIAVVYGSPASSGSEVPPNPTSGWVPMYLVDLTFGQTSVTLGQILTAAPSVGTGVPSNYPYAPFMGGLLRQHHLGTSNGQAPQIDLTAEVKNTLPLTRLPASDIIGGLSTMQIFAGNPNGHVAGNFNVNGAADFAWDSSNRTLYVCTQTGTTSTAIWTAVVGQATSQFSGGTSTGSANAQVIASTTPAGFSLTSGFVVNFTAGFTNTSAATLNVDATGVIAINKSGPVPLTGGEIAAGAFVSVIYTGSVYLIQSAQLGQLATMNLGQWVKNDGSGNLTLNVANVFVDNGSGALTLNPVPATAILNAFVGDSGSGGTKGMVPAPASGAAALNSVLGAGGAFINVGAAMPGDYRRLKITNGGSPTVNMTMTADWACVGNAGGQSLRLSGVSVTGNIGNSGANGLDTGSPTLNTSYAIWLIYNPSTVTAAMLFSLEDGHAGGTPTLPSGYTYYAFFGYALTDAATTWLRQIQYGPDCWYTPVTASNTTGYPTLVNSSGGAVGTFSSSAFTGVSVTITPFIPTRAIEVELLLFNGGGTQAAVAPSNTFGGAFSNNPPPIANLANPSSGGINAIAGGVIGRLPLETRAVFWAATSTASGISCRGYHL